MNRRVTTNTTTTSTTACGCDARARGAVTHCFLLRGGGALSLLWGCFALILSLPFFRHRADLDIFFLSFHTHSRAMSPHIHEPFYSPPAIFYSPRTTFNTAYLDYQYTAVVGTGTIEKEIIMALLYSSCRLCSTAAETRRDID